jgi:phosphonate transport system substrate-binding protein
MSVSSFGVVRSHTVPAFRSAMIELCEKMSSATGHAFTAYIAPSYRELATSIERGEVTLAWAPPVLALDLDARSLAHPMAVPIRSGLASYRTAIIVRERVPASIEELKGVRMAWVDRESSSGYIVPRIHLASLGCDLAKFFTQESFHMSHTAVVDAVAMGRVDAGATFYTVGPDGKLATAGWTDPEGKIVRSVKIASHAGPIPNDMIVASKHLPVAVRASIQRWLLDLDVRSRELFNEIIHSAEFRVPSLAHFEPLRAMMVAARARGVMGE